MPIVNIGLIGYGTVGSGVVKGLALNAAGILSRTGLDLRIKTIADIDIKRDRGVATDARLTTDYRAIVNDPDIQVGIELVGGIKIAFEIISELLKAGKKVVTANKALLAERGPELFQLARKHNTTIAFEASTAGGIPIIAAMRDGLAGNTIESFYGIVNGTSNYILTQMTHKECSYEKALKDAQAQGFAEADPSFDVEGIDSAHKLVMLTAIGFQTVVSTGDIHVEGITKINKTDINFARELGYAVKCLAIGIRRPQGLELRVHPTLVPEKHPLASVNGVFNAICLNGNLVGQALFYGRGAGSLPTASAVIADIIDSAQGGYALRFRHLCYFQEPGAAPQAILPFEETVSRFYVRFTVKDVPGVLAGIAAILNANRISVASLLQKESSAGETGIEMMTHACVEKDFRKAVAETGRLDYIVGRPAFIRAIDMGFESI
ncbi:MAG: homoserine dehydrogenase [Planctomycetota bacterium]